MPLITRFCTKSYWKYCATCSIFKRKKNPNHKTLALRLLYKGWGNTFYTNFTEKENWHLEAFGDLVKVIELAIGRGPWSRSKAFDSQLFAISSLQLWLSDDVGNSMCSCMLTSKKCWDQITTAHFEILPWKVYLLVTCQNCTLKRNFLGICFSTA